MQSAFVTPRDLERIIAAGFDPNAVTEGKIFGGREIRVLKKNSNGCIFLDENKRCSLYEGRPNDCFLFPFDILKIQGKYQWIIYDCRDEKQVSTSDMMVDFLEGTEEFKNLSKYIDEFSTYYDPSIMGKFRYRVIREVRLP